MVAQPVKVAGKQREWHFGYASETSGGENWGTIDRFGKVQARMSRILAKTRRSDWIGKLLGAIF
jgi:hypothetical protein